jgi:hypothetical protein
MTRHAVLPLILLVAFATRAAEPTTETMCVYTVQSSDGKFQLVQSDTLRVLRDDSRDSAFVLPADAPSSVVSLNCIRSSPVPAPSDASVLDVGYGLYISVPTASGKPLVSLEKTEGRYVATLVGGRLSRAEKKLLEASIAEMNARAAAPSAGR